MIIFVVVVAPVVVALVVVINKKILQYFIEFPIWLKAKTTPKSTNFMHLKTNSYTYAYIY